MFGVEGDIQWADENDTAGCGLICLSETGATDTIGSAEQRINWFGTARARLGWANDGWLFYITGGGAWGGIDATTAASETTAGVTVFSASNTTSFTKSGWVFGGGTELRIAGPWTAKFEYLYMDLGSITDTLVLPAAAFGPGVTLSTTSSIHDHIIRAGLNYKFDWAGPVSTRY